jgi:predicted dehydrogenase
MAIESVNLGMVGLGGWGQFVVRNFAQAKNCRLTYLCDANPGTIERHRHFAPQARATSSLDQVLGDNAVDAVAIATPAPLHYDMARAALLAGKHVYVEKPMTLTTAHSEELVELADRQGLKLMVGHLLEYHPAVALMKDQIDSGELGDVYYMYCQRLNLGVVRQQENSFWSLAPHDISVILYLFGQEPTHVVASGQNFLQDGIEDVVFATLYFPDGRMAHIHVSWLDPHKKRSMVVVGSKKMLVFDDMESSEKVRIFDKGARIGDTPVDVMQSISVRHGDILIPRVGGPEPLAAETQHFIDSILNDTTPRSDGRDGLRVVKILEEVDKQLHGRRTKPMRRAA